MKQSILKMVEDIVVGIKPIRLTMDILGQVIG